MAEWKRSIPRVAAATLVLGGSSCAARRPTIDSVARLSCNAYRACEPTYFYSEFATVAQCTNERVASLNYSLDLYETYFYSGAPTSATCMDALLDYYDCISREYRRTCDGDLAYDECIPEYTAAGAFCEFWGYYCYEYYGYVYCY